MMFATVLRKVAILSLTTCAYILASHRMALADCKDISLILVEEKFHSNSKRGIFVLLFYLFEILVCIKNSNTICNFQFLLNIVNRYL